MSEILFKTRLISEKEPKLDVSFECRKDDVVALVGPSGSGKTSILRNIAGLQSTENGEIIINDQSWFNSKNSIYISPQKRSVGLMFQDYALFPHKTAIENISIAINNSSRDNIQQYAKELLALVNLEGLENRYPSQMSGGQKQRVALARALAREPEILLLDEPFSSVDFLTKKKLIKELSLLIKKLEIPVIFVTHDLDEARILASHICIIHHGKSLQFDKTKTVFAKPKNRQVAKLLGMTNLFQACIKEHISRSKTTIIEWDNHLIETNYHPEFQVGETIDWLIPLEYIILHRKDKPSNGEKENPIEGIIKEIIPLGETNYLTVIVKNKHPFTLSLSSHVTKRNQINEGCEISFSLLSDAIHIMKA